MADVMGAGALGIEIIISGKVPSSRAKSWRFYQGYLKKCGDIALTGVDTAYTIAKLKSGIVGIQVRIMPPETKLPDHIELIEEKQEVVEELNPKEAQEAMKEEEKEVADTQTKQSEPDSSSAEEKKTEEVKEK
jgi:small subunit ribosomal protein S3